MPPPFPLARPPLSAIARAMKRPSPLEDGRVMLLY